MSQHDGSDDTERTVRNPVSPALVLWKMALVLACAGSTLAMLARLLHDFVGVPYLQMVIGAPLVWPAIEFYVWLIIKRPAQVKRGA